MSKSKGIKGKNGFVPKFGWVFDQDVLEKATARLKYPQFSTSAKQLKDSGEGKNSYNWLWELWFFEELIKRINQAIGDCVSHAHQLAAQDLLLIDVCTDLTKSIPKEIIDRIKSGNDDGSGIVASEPIYGGSRCEIGGWWNSRSDGSIGEYASRWLKQFGITLRLKNNNGIDLSKYSGSRAKEYGAKGCPDILETETKLHPIKEYTRCSSYEEARDALFNRCTITVASNRGFKMQRNADGTCTPQGIWQHDLNCRGHLILKGNKPKIVLNNSWGDYLGDFGSVIKLENGAEMVLPMSAFLTEPETFTSMAKQGDTWIHSGVNGFIKNDFDDVNKWVD